MNIGGLSDIYRTGRPWPVQCAVIQPKAQGKARLDVCTLTLYVVSSKHEHWMEYVEHWIITSLLDDLGDERRCLAALVVVGSGEQTQHLIQALVAMRFDQAPVPKRATPQSLRIIQLGHVNEPINKGDPPSAQRLLQPLG